MKRGFTDRLYLYNVIFVTLVVITSFVAMFVGVVDSSPISVIVPSAFGELAIHTGFIIEKARKENELKFNKELENEFRDINKDN